MIEEKLKAGIILERTCGKIIPKENIAKDIIRQVYKHKLDILLGPEWLFLPTGRLYTEKEKDEIVNHIAGNTKPTDTLIIPGTIMWENQTHMYNTAPIIYKGTVQEVHKFTDGGTKDRAKVRKCNKPQYKSFEDPKLFKWRDYKIGIEICSDMGDLIRHLQNKYPKDNKKNYMVIQTMEQECYLDLYFLTSSGFVISQDRGSIPIKQGGYGLNSNGDYLPETMVLRREQGGFTFPPRKCTEKGSDTGSGLEIYELNMKKGV